MVNKVDEKEKLKAIVSHSGQNREMILTVDEDEKLNGIIFRAGQNREMMLLTEDRLYEVLIKINFLLYNSK
ncbi:MAG: hypothetical protein ACLVIU_08435 [Paraclostridium sp.]